MNLIALRIEIDNQNFPSNNCLIADTLNNIGLLYYNKGENEEALKYFNQSLEQKFGKF